MHFFKTMYCFRNNVPFQVRIVYINDFMYTHNQTSLAKLIYFSVLATQSHYVLVLTLWTSPFLFLSNNSTILSAKSFPKVVEVPNLEI